MYTYIYGREGLHSRQSNVQWLSRLLVSLATERARVEHEEPAMEDARHNPVPLVPPLLSRSASPPLSPAGSPVAPVRPPCESQAPTPLASDSTAPPIAESAIVRYPEPDAKLCVLTTACNAAVQRSTESGRLQRLGAGFFARCVRT